MTFFETQQKAKESIIKPLVELFTLQANQINVNFDIENIVSVIIHTTPTITYHFAYNMQTNDLQCIMVGAALQENPLSLTAVPVSISLSILQQVRNIIVASLGIEEVQAKDNITAENKPKITATVTEKK